MIRQGRRSVACLVSVRYGKSWQVGMGNVWNERVWLAEVS